MYLVLVERALLASRDLRGSSYESGSRAKGVLRDLEWNSEKYIQQVFISEFGLLSCVCLPKD